MPRSVVSRELLYKRTWPDLVPISVSSSALRTALHNGSVAIYDSSDISLIAATTSSNDFGRRGARAAVQLALNFICPADRARTRRRQRKCHRFVFWPDIYSDAITAATQRTPARVTPASATGSWLKERATYTPPRSVGARPAGDMCRLLCRFGSTSRPVILKQAADGLGTCGT